LIETKGKFSVFSKNYHKDKLEINTGDTECDSTNSYININLLIFKSEDKKTGQKINEIIKKELGLTPKQTYENYVKTRLPEFSGYIDSKINLIYEGNHLLTLENNTREAACGAIHGDIDISYINIDLETNKKIKLEDIFQKRYLENLTNICKQKFKEKYHLQENKLENFYLPKDFAIYKNGISFLFQRYNNGIDISTAGTTNVFIPFSEIRALRNYNTRLTNRLLDKNSFEN
jgi:hypothetical protein